MFIVINSFVCAFSWFLGQKPSEWQALLVGRKMSSGSLELPVMTCANYFASY